MTLYDGFQGTLKTVGRNITTAIEGRKEMHMTQKEKVLRHIREYGIMRLGARIADLEADGIPIKHGRVSVKNRFGENVSVAKYEIQEHESTITDWRSSLNL